VKTDPQALASTRLQQKLLPYPKSHPLYVQDFDEQIADYKAITVDQIKSVYTDLVGASYSDLAVVGDFAPDSVTNWAKTAFGSWKSPKPFARLVRQYFDVPKFTDKIETPDKANAAWFAGQNLKLRDDSKDYAAAVIGNYMMGGGFLNSRFATRIRQKDGISYGVASNVAAQQLDSVGMFQEMAIYNPENVQRLEQAFEEELARVLKDGFTQDEVDKAKQGFLQQMGQNRAQDGFLVNLFSNQAVTGRNMKYDQQYEAWIAALTPADINAAIKKYIDPKKLSVVMAGDFKNKPPKVVP
jgi:zinc protease